MRTLQLLFAAAFLETFATRAAAEKARNSRGAVLEAFDKVWLLTIADAGWRSQGGTHIAEIGPIPGLCTKGGH